MSDNKFVARDFVFAGQRLLKDGTLGDVLIQLKEDGSLGESGTYKAAKGMRLIGGVYRGAEFAETSVRGHTTAAYTGERFDDRVRVSEWTALHDEAKAQYALKRLEANEKQVSQIERDVRPLRETYHAIAARDYLAASAYENAVLRALRKPLRAREKT